MAEPQAQVIRVAPATVAAGTILFSPVLLLGAALLWRGPDVQNGIALCAAYVAAIYWWCAPTIELAPGRLTYRTALRRATVDLAEVIEVAIAAGPALELRRAGRAGEPRAAGAEVLFVRPFSRLALSAVLHHIRASNPAVRLDALALAIRQASREVIARESGSARALVRFTVVLTVAIAAAGLGRLVLR